MTHLCTHPPKTVYLCVCVCSLQAVPERGKREENAVRSAHAFLVHPSMGNGHPSPTLAKGSCNGGTAEGSSSESIVLFISDIDETLRDMRCRALLPSCCWPSQKKERHSLTRCVFFFDMGGGGEEPRARPDRGLEDPQGVVPGACELLTQVAERGVPIVYLTAGSVSIAPKNLAFLGRAGLPPGLLLSRTEGKRDRRRRYKPRVLDTIHKALLLSPGNGSSQVLLFCLGDNVNHDAFAYRVCRGGAYIRYRGGGTTPSPPDGRTIVQSGRCGNGDEPYDSPPVHGRRSMWYVHSTSTTLVRPYLLPTTAGIALWQEATPYPLRRPSVGRSPAAASLRPPGPDNRLSRPVP